MLLLCGAPFAAEPSAPTASAPTPAMATWFDGLGSPYGGCGVPQDVLETRNFVALNVYDKPGDYASFPARPLAGADLAFMGAFANGRECGRWVRVTLGPMCTGINDGAPGQPFCRGPGAGWADDAYSGATLDFIVADSCGDGNAWCRDNPRHLDLSKPSLDLFRKNGAVVTGLYPGHWNNRAIAWDFIPAPDYSGDIRVFFLKGAQPYWPAVLITHLPNGIHGVEQQSDGAWVAAQRYGDLGQGFILKPAAEFRIRLLDAADQPVFGGRVYAFDPPASCGGGGGGGGGGTCSDAVTPVVYRVVDNGAAVRAPSARDAFPSLGLTLGLAREPGTHALRLDWPAAPPGSFALEARDLRGGIIARTEGAHQFGTPLRMRLSDLPSGAYVVVLRLQERVFLRRIVAAP